MWQNRCFHRVLCLYKSININAVKTYKTKSLPDLTKVRNSDL